MFAFTLSFAFNHQVTVKCYSSVVEANHLHLGKNKDDLIKNKTTWRRMFLESGFNYLKNDLFLIFL